MSVKRFASLLFKLSQIQALIDREQKRRLPNLIRLLRLKSLSLSVRNRLARVSASFGKRRSMRRPRLQNI